jgi:hypothetical protein
MVPYRPLAIAGLLAAFLAVGGCADRDPSSPLRSMETGKARTCLMAPLETTKIIDDSTLLMIDRSGNAAVAHMSGACLIDPTSAVIMKYHGTDSVCGPLDVDISGTVTGGIPTPCIIKSMEPVSKAQAQTLLNGKPAQ